MRRRILVAIVSVTAVAVVLFAVPLAFALSDLYREEEIIRLERAAAEAAERIPTSFSSTGDPVELPRNRNNRRTALYDRTFARVSGRGPRTADAIARAALRGGIRDTQIGDTLVVATPVTRDEQVVGALRIETPISTVTDRTTEAILVMAGIGMLVVSISALIATWQARRITLPVDRLAAAAARLGDGDFTVQSERSGIPELDAVSDALGTTATRLDQMLTRERTFSEDASHQLRTPLTGLRITLEATRLDPSGDRDAALVTALSEVDRLEQTIDDLLALAREHPANRTELDLGPLLSELGNDWRSRLADDGRPLRVILDPKIPRAKASGRSLRQVLDVLVDNAWRHGSGGVRVHARRALAGVVIEVSDEGEGVRGEPDAIFERRTPGAAHHGIGLALARSLAEADGLRLELIDMGPGPVFAVFLPTATEDPGSIAVEPSRSGPG